MSYQLLKKRDFNALISDTFGFFKAYGKPYLKGFFVINGIVILLLLVTTFFFSRVFMDDLLNSMERGYSSSRVLEQNLIANENLYIGLVLLISVVLIILTLVLYLYPVAFLNKVAKGEEITNDALFGFIKRKVGKAILFFLASLVTFVPIFIVTFSLISLLVMFLIGIPLLFIFAPLMISWVMLSFYDYISTDNGFLKSIGVGYNFATKKFWPTVGSTLIIYMIINAVTSILFFIPYLITIVSFIASAESASQSSMDMRDTASTMFFVMTLIIIFTSLISIIMQNLMLVNQGVIYYSNLEERDNISVNSEIDAIGLSEEE